MNVPLNLSSGSGGRKQFNIAPEFANSPYLTKPIGIHHEKQRRSGSPATETHKATSTTRKDKQQGDTQSLAEVSSKRDSDVESLASLKSHHTARSQKTQQSFRSVVNTTRRSLGGAANKSFLLPREMDKLLREFRQKNSNHSILAQAAVQTKHQDDDDSSTIASDFAECLDDKGMYVHVCKDPSVVDALFSGPLFAELAFRNSSKDRSGGPIGPMLILPPLESRTDDKNRSASGDLSDLDSLQSGTESRRRR